MTATIELVPLKCPKCGTSPVEKRENKQSNIIGKKLVHTTQTLYHCTKCNCDFMNLGVHRS